MRSVVPQENRPVACILLRFFGIGGQPVCFFDSTLSLLVVH